MLKFTKMQGLGNSYIYVNGFTESVENPHELSKICSNYHFGVGAEGLVLILPSECADFKMRLFNGDGSEAEIGGNAVRCVAKYVYEKGMTDKKSISLETLSGLKELELTVNENNKVVSITVNMGKFKLNPAEIPIVAEGESVIHKPIKVGNKELRFTAVSIGNPHAVVFAPNADDVNVDELGPLFEHHELFPQRTNVEFVQLIDRDRIKIRVWERGNGETWACGTGACASVVASILNGLCDYDEEITVELTGGELTVLCRADGTVIKKGPAEFIYDGVLSDDLL